MIQKPIQQDEQIEDVQDEPDGSPVSADYLGKITTIEGIEDAIGSVLNYVEVIGRALNKNEITAFKWIEKAYCMPLYEQQIERLQGKQLQRLLDAMTEFEELLYPSHAESPQRIVPLRVRKTEEKAAKEEAKRKRIMKQYEGSTFLFDECMN